MAPCQDIELGTRCPGHDLEHLPGGQGAEPACNRREQEGRALAARLEYRVGYRRAWITCRAHHLRHGERNLRVRLSQGYTPPTYRPLTA